MNDDAQLRRIFSDAVADVEPHDRIDVLRASVRPSPKVVPMARSRSWYAVAGIVATAAVIGVIAYLTSVAGTRSDELGPADGGTALPSVTASDPEAAQTGGSTGPRLTDLPVYYLGHSPRGEVLFCQQTPVPSGLPPLRAAVSRLMATPYDQDYRPGWSAGWLTSAEVSDGVIRVDLGGAPLARPEGMSARTAYLVVQSAIYTLQAAAHSDVSVLFLRGGLPVATVLGVPAGHPLLPGSATGLLSRVDISRPAVDGMRAHGGRLVVTGTAQAPVDRVLVRLVEDGPQDATTTVQSRSALSGSTADVRGRYRWRVVVDTSGVKPGTYTLLARDGGRGGDTDSRIVVVRQR